MKCNSEPSVRRARIARRCGSRRLAGRRRACGGALPWRESVAGAGLDVGRRRAAADRRRLHSQFDRRVSEIQAWMWSVSGFEDVCPRLERVQFVFLDTPMAEITSIRDRIKGLDARREALWGYL